MSNPKSHNADAFNSLFSHAHYAENRAPESSAALTQESPPKVEVKPPLTAPLSLLAEYAKTSSGLRTIWTSRADRRCYALVGFPAAQVQFKRNDGRVITLPLLEAELIMQPAGKESGDT